MLGTIIFVVVIFILFSTLLYLFDPEKLKLYKLKKIIEYKYNTKVEFCYKTKLVGTHLYIFGNNSITYTISEFGNICGKRQK